MPWSSRTCLRFALRPASTANGSWQPTSTCHDHKLQFAVATDDVMLFSTDSATSGAAALRLDQALEQHHVDRNPRKDVTNVLDTSCIGVDLVEGRR